MSEKQKIISFDELRALRERKNIAHCHGVFDVLHVGHLSYLKSARAFGDLLVVTLTADRHVNKGPNRPYFGAVTRAKMIASLEIVDFVCISDHPTAVPAIQAIRPKFYVKGPDYKDRTKDVTGEIYNEERAVEDGGGRLVFTEDETHSSSELINRFFLNWSDDQIRVIEGAKKLGGMSKIYDVLERMSKLKVTVVGEPITDTYRFCVPENISSKSPSISARFKFEENYQGGAFAIAKHLNDFIDKGYFLVPEGLPEIRKTRYISIDKNQRIFEITEMPDDSFKLENSSYFCGNLLDHSNSSDMLIVADFGHRLFEGDVLRSLSDVKCFTALNVQTNSSNYGFNVFKKHQRFDYLSLDTREARLAYHDRNSDPHTLARKIRDDIYGTFMSLTLGSNGAYFFGSGHEYLCPAFSDVVIDATGAGDAYFAITSCLLKCGCDHELIPFLGNIFAGLKTKIIGNKYPVSKASFVKAVEAILK